jgi:hypothetical protein
MSLQKLISRVSILPTPQQLLEMSNKRTKALADLRPYAEAIAPW